MNRVSQESVRTAVDVVCNNHCADFSGRGNFTRGGEGNARNCEGEESGNGEANHCRSKVADSREGRKEVEPSVPPWADTAYKYPTLNWPLAEGENMEKSGDVNQRHRASSLMV